MLNLKKKNVIQRKSSQACFVTARKWCTILLTSFDACHRPVAMRVQQSPKNTMRSYVFSLVNNIENHNVRSVIRARAQAFVDQVCGECPSAAGRLAPFSKLNEKPRIFPELCR